MDTTAVPSRPRDRRLLVVVALVAGLAGVLLGRAWPGSSPAGATVDTWHTPTYEDEAFEEGFEDTPPGYGIDDEEFTHLKGVLVATEVDVARANGTSGPWLTSAFYLPCGFRPTQTVVMEVGGADHGFSAAYRGMLHITVDGNVSVGAWDVPVQPVEDPEADFLVLLDGVSFQAAPDGPECVEHEPPVTTTTETTTTTTEPEE